MFKVNALVAVFKTICGISFYFVIAKGALCKSNLL